MPRIPESIKQPSQLFGTNQGTLSNLYHHARDLVRLQEIVRDFMPGEVYVASAAHGTLHLITPSSAFATRLRYHQRKLLMRLPRDLAITQIKVSVRPTLSRPAPPSREALPISPENARHLANTAKYIEDEGLSKALLRLSGRSRQT